MILGIYGFQDAGKTKLVEELVRRLVMKGYRVSSIKHTPHEKSIDCEGKDTWRHWKAGSDPVVFSSDSETAYIKHSRTPANDIAGLVTREFGPDVVIVEGFKEGAFPKVAVGKVKRRRGTVMVNPEMDELVAYVENEVAVEKTMRLLPGLDCRKCGLECEGLARAIVARKRKLGDCRELSSVDVRIVVGGKKIAAGRFVSNVVDGAVRGMLSSLKGYEPGKEVEIRLAARREKSKAPR